MQESLDRADASQVDEPHLMSECVALKGAQTGLWEASPQTLT